MTASGQSKGIDMNILNFLSALYKNRYVASAIGVFLIVCSFYVYHVHASHRIETLERDNKELSRKLDEQQKQIESLKLNYDQIIKAKEDLLTEVESLKTQQRQEEEKLYRENRKKKSLEELAIKKTGLVQKAINKATKNVFECFVTLSKGGDC